MVAVLAPVIWPRIRSNAVPTFAPIRYADRPEPCGGHLPQRLADVDYAQVRGGQSAPDPRADSWRGQRRQRTEIQLSTPSRKGRVV